MLLLFLFKMTHDFQKINKNYLNIYFMLNIFDFFRRGNK